jgi:hypothetical protein
MQLIDSAELLDAGPIDRAAIAAVLLEPPAAGSALPSGIHRA